jgi:hypothetical protein
MILMENNSRKMGILMNWLLVLTGIVCPACVISADAKVNFEAVKEINEWMNKIKKI